MRDGAAVPCSVCRFCPTTISVSCSVDSTLSYSADRALYTHAKPANGTNRRSLSCRNQHCANPACGANFVPQLAAEWGSHGFSSLARNGSSSILVSLCLRASSLILHNFSCSTMISLSNSDLLLRLSTLGQEAVSFEQSPTCFPFCLEPCSYTITSCFSHFLTR